MIRILALWLAMTLPAAGTQDAWPALFDVVGVASDDTLNVRAAPDPGAVILGELAHDATDIEVVTYHPNTDWGQVNIGERSGWVSLRFLKRQPNQFQGVLPDAVACYGTEPFWDVSLNGNDGRLGEMGAADRVIRKIEKFATSHRRDRWAFVGDLPGGNVTGVVVTAACNDGMSDRRFGMTLDLIVRGNDRTAHLSGCCSLR